MRRADRLFEIIQLLRTRKLTTAKWLSERLEVSERTIYRDVQDLISCGVPIDSAAGIGYVLHKDYDLPPLMFNLQEMTSLIIGIQMTLSLGGKVAQSAETALSKINHVLPKELRRAFQETHIYTPPFYEQETIGDHIAELNIAIQQSQVVELHYQKPQQSTPNIREVYPLGIFFWKDRWTLAAWCTLKNDFRHFRLDRMFHMKPLETIFKLEKDQTLQTFFKSVTTQQDC